MLPACEDGYRGAPLDDIAQPAALALAPGARYLSVANGDLDGRAGGSTVIQLNLSRLTVGMESPVSGADERTRSAPCWRPGPAEPLRCDATLLISERDSIAVEMGAAGVAWRDGNSPAASGRMLVASRGGAATLTWIDADRLTSDTPTFSCDQRDNRRCGPGFQTGLNPNPATIRLPVGAAPYAVIPHLQGGRLSLVDLEAPGGPTVVDVESSFFREDPVHDSGLAGGFDVVGRPCVPPALVPAQTLECSRPYLYASERHWWGLRSFQIATGLDVIVPSDRVEVPTSAQTQTPPRPIGGGIAFEDPEVGDRLLFVQTTPSSLVRMDTSLDDTGTPRHEVLANVPLCANPNHVAVHRPEGVATLALVSCFDADRLAVLELPSMSQIASVPTGAGPDEVIVDAGRALAYVANAKDSSLSVVQLDPQEPTYLEEVARVESRDAATTSSATP